MRDDIEDEEPGDEDGLPDLPSSAPANATDGNDAIHGDAP